MFVKSFSSNWDNNMDIGYFSAENMYQKHWAHSNYQKNTTFLKLLHILPPPWCDPNYGEAAASSPPRSLFGYLFDS
jgi:hypothetical protein